MLRMGDKLNTNLRRKSRQYYGNASTILGGPQTQNTTHETLNSRPTKLQLINSWRKFVNQQYQTVRVGLGLR